MFQNIGKVVSSKRTGLGLGLSICRSIVEAHGGRIWAEDNRGGGMTVHVELPVLSAQCAVDSETGAASLAPPLEAEHG